MEREKMANFAKRIEVRHEFGSTEWMLTEIGPGDTGSFLSACPNRLDVRDRFNRVCLANGWAKKKEALAYFDQHFPPDYGVSAEKKRKRQVRDALNKCTDHDKIEKIGRLLGV